MSEPEITQSHASSRVIVAFAVLGLLTIASLFFNYHLNNRVQSLEEKQAAAQEKLQQSIAAANSRVDEVNESFSHQEGLTRKAMAARTSQLQREERVAESRLTEQQQKQQQALGEVTGQVSSVKTEVGGVKTDVAATRNDLEATKAKLERAVGDMGVQSGLIATTREELEYLKHRGDRNYYDFTLTKGKSPVPVSTVSLLLKKADAKKGKFTLNVVADDKSIEKKDRTMNEPLQFYTGRDKMLYELVVYNVEKNKVTGYISTPKGAPVPLAR